MARQIINVGTSANDGTGDTLRVSQQKANANFADLYDTGGAEITVNNPVTLTPTDLDTALADLVGTGGAVDSVNGQTGVVSIDLQSVLTEGNEAPLLPIKVGELQLYNAPDDNYVKIYANENEIIFDNLIDITRSFTLDKGSLTSSKIYYLPNETGFFNVVKGVVSNFTAELYSFYIAKNTITVTDPTPVTNAGYQVHVIGGSVTIGGVAYTSGALVYRYYDGSVWISKNYNQDLQSVLTNRGTVIEGDNELYLNVIDGILDYSGNGATSGFQFNIGVDQDVYLNNVNIPSGKRAEYRIDTNGNLKLIQKSASDTFGTEITITEPTANRSINFKDESGTVAFTSDIPAPITIDATPTDGSSNAVSSNGVFDALATKQDTLVSGTNIKTIEGQSLLGIGNIDLTKSDVGLSNVDNTSDANKPVSTAQQTALDLKANLASPALTGTPTAPTQSANDNSTKIATTAYADAKVQNSLSASTTIAPSATQVNTALDLKANVNRSETFIFSKANGTFGTHTGTTAETVILTSSITGGVFEIGDWLNLMYDFTITGTAGTKTIRFRAGTTGTTADALIGTLFLTATALDSGWSRERMQFKTGNILSGIANNFTSNPFDIAPNTVAKQSTSLNPANTWILSVTVQLANSADTVSCEGYVISRVKSF